MACSRKLEMSKSTLHSIRTAAAVLASAAALVFALALAKTQA